MKTLPLVFFLTEIGSTKKLFPVSAELSTTHRWSMGHLFVAFWTSFSTILTNLPLHLHSTLHCYHPIVTEFTCDPNCLTKEPKMPRDWPLPVFSDRLSLNNVLVSSIKGVVGVHWSACVQRATFHWCFAKRLLSTPVSHSLRQLAMRNDRLNEHCPLICPVADIYYTYC